MRGVQEPSEPIIRDKKLSDGDREERRTAQAAAADKRSADAAARGGVTGQKAGRSADANNGQQQPSVMSPGAWN
eukprot:CAMPEP_0183437070 /NCGR_PEP_ID=MMETSP0370-20130417/71469_1 /TAXON_ID=268820 /ORGANISM="Peridinium aciculiferum, Strain PAER-2" /LENGTH=73 /DNA_ID=CAMNT_0025624735 /DNA_START=153 /DNA_END=374 /DNA_ORIENTATION=-